METETVSETLAREVPNVPAYYIVAYKCDEFWNGWEDIDTHERAHSLARQWHDMGFKSAIYKVEYRPIAIYLPEESK